MLARLGDWLVLESKPVAGMESRIIAMVAAIKNGVRVAIVDENGVTCEMDLDEEQLRDFQTALFQKIRLAVSIKELQDKLIAEGKCPCGCPWPETCPENKNQRGDND